MYRVSAVCVRVHARAHEYIVQGVQNMKVDMCGFGSGSFM
jgi:hypothetical protein